MRSSVLLCIAIASIATVGIARAALPQPHPGHYEAEGGHGELDITRVASGLHFAIESMGVNAHSCSLEGPVRGGVGVVADENSGECRIALKPAGNGYDVESITSDTCRAWCGARGRFDYAYRPLPPQCAPARYQARRNEFLALYKARQYDAALASATRLRDECVWFRWFPDRDALANDIALTQYHLKRPADCLATLKQTFAWDYATAADARDSLPPVEAESYEAIARSTMTNRGLCQAALKQAR